MCAAESIVVGLSTLGVHTKYAFSGDCTAHTAIFAVEIAYDYQCLSGIGRSNAVFTSRSRCPPLCEGEVIKPPLRACQLSTK